MLQNVLTKCTNLVPKGRIEALQLTHIPQMLAAYIQYKYKYYRMYFPKPCQKMHRNPLNYTIPPIFGRIYPIPIYRFNWHIFLKFDTNIFIKKYMFL